MRLDPITLQVNDLIVVVFECRSNKLRLGTIHRGGESDVIKHMHAEAV